MKRPTTVSFCSSLLCLIVSTTARSLEKTKKQARKDIRGYNKTDRHITFLYWVF